MQNNLISISGKTYYFDIDAIMKWCLASSATPFNEVEINEGYDTDNDGDMMIMSKVVRELKTNNIQDDTIRYDFFKLIATPFIMNEEINLDEISNNFSYTLLFNTLLNKGFLVEISESN